jgi:hypothetical protein
MIQHQPWSATARSPRPCVQPGCIDNHPYWSKFLPTPVRLSYIFYVGEVREFDDAMRVVPGRRDCPPTSTDIFSHLATPYHVLFSPSLSFLSPSCQFTCSVILLHTLRVDIICAELAATVRDERHRRDSPQRSDAGHAIQ